MLKRIINTSLWTAVGALALIISLIHVPAVQGLIGSELAETLSRKVGSEVAVGRVNIGFANRVIIDDVLIKDQQGQPLMSAARLSAKIDIIPLLAQEISVASSQVFGLKLNIYKDNAAAKPNYQFLIDSLSSKKSGKRGRLSLKIKSLVFRHGEVKFRQKDKAAANGVFSPYDVALSNISGHIVINALTNDSIDARVKKLSFDEASDLHLKSLSLAFKAGTHGISVEDLSVSLPNTALYASSVRAKYRQKQPLLSLHDADVSANIGSNSITLSDFSFLNPALKGVDESFSLTAKIGGILPQLRVDVLQIDAHNGMFSLFADGKTDDILSHRAWKMRLSPIRLDTRGMKLLAELFGNNAIPEQILRLEEVAFSGTIGGDREDLFAEGLLQTGAGDANMTLEKHGGTFSGRVTASNFDLRKITNDNRLGLLSAELNIVKNSSDTYEGDGKISRFDYNGYAYSDIAVNGSYDRKGLLAGSFAIKDPNADIVADGKALLKDNDTAIEADAVIRNLDLEALRISDKWKSTKFSADISADIKSIRTAHSFGRIDIKDFLMEMPERDFRIEHAVVSATPEGDGGQRIALKGDFGELSIAGKGDMKTLPESIARLVGGKLYTLTAGIDKKKMPGNEYSFDVAMNSSEWMDCILGVPLHIESPLTIKGRISDRQRSVSLSCALEGFTYSGKAYKDASVNVSTANDTIITSAKVKKISDDGKSFSWKVKASVGNNQLGTVISLNDDECHPLRGELKANTRFDKDADGGYTALISVEESDMHIGDTVWHIRPSNIVYKEKCVKVNGFAMSHDDQYLRVNGNATVDRNDTLHVNFKDVDVGYILDMVNFHSVEFDGQASGNAFIAGAFNARPVAKARLSVSDFRFENGRMGTLNASVRYDDISGSVNINATADDEGFGYTDIKGYVSPVHNHISLDINARNTRLEFMESFCGSFMRDVDARANGAVRLSGALNDINLTGQLVVDGSMGISSLNTAYTMRNDTVRFIPDEIEFRRDTIYDRNGNIGIVNGNLHHEHLTNLSYDFGITAHNMLCYDTTPAQGESFYGTVYATGDCKIKGGNGEVVMDIDVTPNSQTVVTYNIDTQDTEDANEFLVWKKRGDDNAGYADGGANEEKQSDKEEDDPAADVRHIATDIKLNFLINCTPDATLKVIMDNASGDYIALNGDGILRSTYYNKGAFDIFGNYVVDHGLYKLTIQNVVRKDFSFEKGGTVKFGGDPFNANLDLKAVYVLNSVSLSDLNIGRSFSNNNVRVNCLMNIGGTAREPRVTFDLDTPTLENDARQMVASVINAEEGMNQQVFYLLAVGRFYTQGNNNAASYGSTAQRNQASLAMQSILSGTISQQINTFLGTVMNSDNWNFGANISTGTEGFNDAEYEGILSGSLLNNRLLLNGQFGYRDNANATTSFIGDFDLKYLLFPNGNLAINVYNKTNDRYFTRNSLNTQGVGLIIKKDFNGILDLFGKEKKKSSKSIKQ